MIRALRISTNVRLERGDFRRALWELGKKGWRPAALSSELSFAREAKIPEAEAVNRGLRGSVRRTRAEFEVDADYFFQGDEVFWAIIAADNRVYFTLGQDLAIDKTVDSGPLELGVVTKDEEGGMQRLRTLAADFEEAVRTCVDGRKTRHMNFEWTSPEQGQERLKQLCKQLEVDGSEVRFRTPDLEAAAEASEVLTDRGIRELLQEVSRAGFVREPDLLARRQKREEEIRQRLEASSSAGLLSSQYLLQCRNSNSPLTRLSEPDELDPATVGGLPCATCGRKFLDELLTRGYLLSDLGRSMVQGNHWMTVWVTKRLVSLGVPRESILWNLEEATEEIDIVLEFLGELWIVELKDRDFQPGDAHSLNYRRVRYGADKTVIATTGKVSTGTKRVFEDLAKEAQKTMRVSGHFGTSASQPIYLEGLSGIEKGFEKEMSEAERRFALRVLRPVAQATGFDVSARVAAIG